eukprot:10748980-Alexandrium_andersonii.AAC.1
MRSRYKDVAIEPDQRLDQTEARDVRMMPIADRRRLAMRMLQRITFRQRKAGIDISGHQLVLHSSDVPDGFYDGDANLEQVRAPGSDRGVLRLPPPRRPQDRDPQEAGHGGVRPFPHG